MVKNLLVIASPGWLGDRCDSASKGGGCWAGSALEGSAGLHWGGGEDSLEHVGLDSDLLVS